MRRKFTPGLRPHRQMTILGSGADGARSGPGGVGLRGAQLPSPAQERSQEERAAECQMNKSVAHGEGPAGTAGEVESWNTIERADVPERGVKRLEDLARPAPDPQRERQRGDEEGSRTPRQHSGELPGQEKSDGGPAAGHGGDRDPSQPARRQLAGKVVRSGED